MDKNDQCKIPNCGNVPDLRKENLVVGAKQLKKAVRGGRVKFVVLAQNADPAILEPIEALCGEAGIPVHWAASMSELGRCCGIEVGAVAAAALL